MTLRLTNENPQFLVADATGERVGIRQPNGFDCYQWLVLGGSAVASAHTGDTTKTELARCRIPALLPNSRLRVTTMWSVTGSTNAKTLAFEYGGSTFLGRSESTSSTVSLRDQREICNRGSTASQVVLPTASMASFGVNTAAPTARTVETNIAKDLIFYGTLALDSETVTLESWLVELLQMP